MSGWHFPGSDRLARLIRMAGRAWLARDYGPAKTALYLLICAATAMYAKADREERRQLRAGSQF